ncbi:MAG: ASPIC/UnbV domain-containing protein, partial [Planctomycetales bacterium]|nr:ASPIC/UnbV domain-containing protein [Planctomycetales bacterium]
MWQSNRTSPRLRFLRNDERQLTRDEPTGRNNWISLKLVGRNCNADAIGARISLYPVGTDKPIVRTLRAGDGYLAQSSKRLHIGLGPDMQLSHLTVRWPDGTQQTVNDISLNRQLEIIQDQTNALAWQRPQRAQDAELPERPNQSEPIAALRRIVPHRRLPIPQLEFVDGDAQTQTVRTFSPCAVFLWASWCGPCLTELAELAKHQQSLEEQGIRVVLISLDEVETNSTTAIREALQVLPKLSQSQVAGIATDSTKSVADLIFRYLLSRQRPLSIPCSLLLDEQGRLAVAYQGGVTIEQLLQDVQRVRDPDGDRRDQAVPLAGRWFVNEVPADLMSMVKKLATAGLASEALSYLDYNLLPMFTDDLPSDTIWSAEQVSSAYL